MILAILQHFAATLVNLHNFLSILFCVRVVGFEACHGGRYKIERGGLQMKKTRKEQGLAWLGRGSLGDFGCVYG